jgi:hypothetical protein
MSDEKDCTYDKIVEEFNDYLYRLQRQLSYNCDYKAHHVEYKSFEFKSLCIFLNFAWTFDIDQESSI